MNELWKEIPRYPHCEVSNIGKVRYKEDFYRSCHKLTKLKDTHLKEVIE